MSYTGIVYYPGSFEPLAIVRNEEFYLYHNEHNGCPSRLLDESGKVVWAARYDAWGKVKKLPVDEVDQPLRLQGQYFDRETGLHYNRFRYYCAEIGSFVSQDPLGLLAGENVYSFGPNTQKWIDPLGLACTKAQRELYKSTMRQVETSLDFSTVDGKAMFYSGPGNRAKALEFADKMNRTPIDYTPGGRYLDSLDLYSKLPADKADRIWAQASRQYAKGTSGEINLFVNGARDDRVFRMVEEPILKNNSSVYKWIFRGY